MKLLVDLSKPFLQEKLPAPAYDVIRRLSHLGPAHLRWRIGRGRAALRRRQIDDLVVDLHGGLTVDRGPFAGMTLQRDGSWGHDLPSQLLGVYEQELHDAIEQAVARRPDHVYDIGCADGYYVVGLATRLTAAQVHGYDVEPRALALTRRLADLNGVSHRVHLHGRCDRRDLVALPSNSLVVMDCEGAEQFLLTDEVAATNPTTMFIVECHDVRGRSVSRLLQRRFSGRSVQVVRATPRVPADAPILAPHLAVEALDEGRQGGADWRGRWLVVI